jgi:hypothetical protein
MTPPAGCWLPELLPSPTPLPAPGVLPPPASPPLLPPAGSPAAQAAWNTQLHTRHCTSDFRVPHSMQRRAAGRMWSEVTRVTRSCGAGVCGVWCGWVGEGVVYGQIGGGWVVSDVAAVEG